METDAASQPALRVAVAHRRGDFRLDVQFALAAPGIVGVFGPSGAGKSTLLAAIAGLLRADHAEIWLGAAPLHDLPPERRGIGFVFQDGRLFPHLSVAANLRFGMRRSPRPGIGLDAVATMLGIGHLLHRRPAALSGGERQRVALGRALLAHPRLLLMDEPLAGLDTPRRQEIMPCLRQVAAAAGVPVLYVTHARDELLLLADHAALLDAGRLTAFGTIPDLFGRADLDFARRDDAAGVLQGRIAAHLPARGLTQVACGPVMLLVPFVASPPGTALRLVVPAREVILALSAPEHVSVNNVLPAQVRCLAPAAAHTVTAELALGEARLLARITPDAVRRLGLAAGSDVLALVKSVGVEVI